MCLLLCLLHLNPRQIETKVSILFGNREPLAAVTINVALNWDRWKENTLPLSFKKSSSSHLAEFALACHPWTEGGPVLSLSQPLLWENPDTRHWANAVTSVDTDCFSSGDSHFNCSNLGTLAA